MQTGRGNIQNQRYDKSTYNRTSMYTNPTLDMAITIYSLVVRQHYTFWKLCFYLRTDYIW